MKNRTFRLFGVLVLTLAASQIYGLSAPPIITANIPFAFTIQGKTLPAGQYTIERVWSTDTQTLLIRGDNSRRESLFLSETAQRLAPSKQTELIFDKIGNHYFLREVWTAGAYVGREIPEPKAKKEVRNASLTPMRVSVPARG